MSTNRNLDRSLVQGIAWTGGIKWLTQLFSWTATLLIARLLTPTDYGLAGMAMIYLGLAQIVSDAGINAAIIQKRQLTEAQITTLNGLSIMVGVALCAITLGLATPVSWFFGEPELQAVMGVLSLTFLTRSVQIVPRSLLARDLDFRGLAWVDGLEAVTLTLGTLALALAHTGYWALVLGAVGSSIATSALCLWWRPHRVTFPRTLASVAEAARFGWQVVTAQLAWYVYTNADFAVVGRVLGKAALGAYTFAWTIASIPVDRVSGLVGRVTPAFFAAVQDDPAALRRYLLNLTEALAFITIPACIGLAIVAREFVDVVLGPTWRGAAVPLRLLAIYAAFRSIMIPASQIILATGHAKQSMYFSLIAAVVLPVTFYIGSRWGVAGVAMGWIIAYPLVAIGLFLRYAFRLIGLSAGQYLRSVWPAIGATAVMTLAVLALRTVLPPDWQPVSRLLPQVLLGAAVYGTIVVTVHGARLRAVRALLHDPGAGGRDLPLPTYQTADRPQRPRLLLLSYHFPPDPAIGALRWEKLGRYAAARGWGLDVITLHPADLASRDPGRLADLPEAVRVYGVPLTPSRVEAVISAAWSLFQRVALIGARTVGWNLDDAEQYRRESRNRRDMRRWVGEPRDLLRAYFAWLEYARHATWARHAANLALRIADPDRHRAVITCGPPHMVHTAGVRVSRRTGLPLVLDFRDPWSLVQRLPEAIASALWVHLARRHERRAVRQASLIVANTAPLRNAMRGQYAHWSDRIITVLNGYDDDPTPPSRRGPRFTIAYAGSIYLDRDPRCLFRAVARMARDLGLTPAELGIEFMGSVQRYDGVPVPLIAAEEGISEFVTIHAAGLRAQALEFLSRAHVLVILPQDSDMAIPAKVFDYMRFDAWLLALAERGSATHLLLDGTGADVVAPQDVEGLANVLKQRYAAHRGGEHGQRLAGQTRFSRAAQADALFSSLESIVGSPVELAERGSPPGTRFPSPVAGVA